MGKGDHTRPKFVDDDTFARNWERAFEQRERDSRAAIEDALLAHQEEVFSLPGVHDLEEVPRVTGESGQVEDAGVAGQSPKVEGS